MGVVSEKLVGPDVVATVMTVTNGGTWIRPLRGDMLRLPETEPQVRMCMLTCCWHVVGMLLTCCWHVVDMLLACC